jgi:hypothetical protein
MGSKWRPGDRVQIRSGEWDLFDADRNDAAGPTSNVWATIGQTGTVTAPPPERTPGRRPWEWVREHLGRSSVSGDVVYVKWDAQEWKAVVGPGAPFGDATPYNVELGTFVKAINGDRLGPLK